LENDALEPKISSEAIPPQGTASTNLNALFQQLSSSAEGLNSTEAKKRLEQYGPNALEVKTESALLKFLGYFWGPIPWMIEAAAILSGILEHWADLIIILALLIFNAIVGWAARHLPARLDVAATAKLLGFMESDIQILMSVRKLIPLGDPAPNAPKWFAAVEMIRLAADKDWLHRATKEIAKYWRLKRERRHAATTGQRL
jgi:magnesium-transporting ATPase (P-type)